MPSLGRDPSAARRLRIRQANERPERLELISTIATGLRPAAPVIVGPARLLV
jgi:hypothetical protein